MYEIEIWANEEFFNKKSLYDGELVGDAIQLTYVVFDVIQTKGTRCGQLSYKERLMIIHNTILCVSDIHDDDSIENMIHEECRFLARNNEFPLNVKPKRCVSKSNVEELWAESVSSPHKNDGLIFTQNNHPIETGTSSSIFKWKSCHSIDLKFEFLDDKWIIYCNSNNSSELINITEEVGGIPIVIVEKKFLNAISRVNQ